MLIDIGSILPTSYVEITDIGFTSEWASLVLNVNLATLAR